MSERDPVFMGGLRDYEQFLRGDGSTGPFEPEPFDEEQGCFDPVATVALAEELRKSE